jgi:hypothetical protein
MIPNRFSANIEQTNKFEEQERSNVEKLVVKSISEIMIQLMDKFWEAHHSVELHGVTQGWGESAIFLGSLESSTLKQALDHCFVSIGNFPPLGLPAFIKHVMKVVENNVRPIS